MAGAGRFSSLDSSVHSNPTDRIAIFMAGAKSTVTIDIPKPSQSSARPFALPTSIRYSARLSNRLLTQRAQQCKDRLWCAVMSQLSLAFWSTTARAVTVAIAFYWTIIRCTTSPIGSLTLLGQKWRQKYQFFLSYQQFGWACRIPMCESRWNHRKKLEIKDESENMIWINVSKSYWVESDSILSNQRWHQSRCRFYSAVTYHCEFKWLKF